VTASFTDPGTGNILGLAFRAGRRGNWLCLVCRCWKSAPAGGRFVPADDGGGMRPRPGPAMACSFALARIAALSCRATAARIARRP
jgi:hypothetical protein